MSTRPEPLGTSRSPDEATPAAEPSLVVGVGASAGGVEALQRFFAYSVPDTGAAYVVVLHLSPDHESHLAEVLQPVTSMPIAQATRLTMLEPNHVYVVSPNQTLESVGSRLAVHDMTRPEHRRAPVDTFFRTLADAHGARSVAVILSGTGADGSVGIRRVKECGGLVLAQDPDEAKHGEMPRNAVATGHVDMVVPIAEMGARISSYRQRLGRVDTAVTEADGNSEAVREILTVLRLRTGNDFANYKASTLLRRIDRRVHVRKLASLREYATLIREDADEPALLMKELLISVTSVFRDAEAFAVLEKRFIPRLMEHKSGSDQVRVWVVGCATGEEAYSIAILLAECAATMADPPSIQVFASDLDEQAIGIAREGLYTEAELADVSEERVRRFFQREAAGYLVRRELRELVLFAHHNVIKDPPFSHLDLISCRNLLIYLNRAVQERVLETFHFALRPGGFLFLGTSESTDGSNDLFVAVDPAAHVYESRGVTSRPRLPASQTAAAVARPSFRGEARVPPRLTPLELHHRLLEELAPPSLIVTEDLNVLHISEGARRYLQVSAGEPSRDLLVLIRPELRNEVRTAVYQALRERAGVVVRGIPMQDAASPEHVDVTVRPVFRHDDPPRGYLLLLFEGGSPRTGQAGVQELVPAAAPPGNFEDEISRLKGELRATIEQYETHVEETKASNEELQAMNEELRSSAEELETSKEELQSVNEELTTVNQELKIKLEELALTNDDILNLINATDIATVFLDRTLRLKMWTPRAQEVFNLRPGDIGRPLSDVTTKLADEGLHDDLQNVLEQLQTVERDVPAKGERWYHLRTRPYRTTDNRIEGVVMTLQDVTGRHEAERRLRNSEERLRLLIDGAFDYAIFTLTLDGRVDSWNSGAQRMFGFAPVEILGKDAEVLFTPEDRSAGVPQRELAHALRDGRAEDERWHMRKDGSRLYCSGVTMRLGEAEPIGFAKIARDLTERRQAEHALQQAQSDLDEHVRERTGELQAQGLERAAAEASVSGLLRKLVTAQEDERARIARDLHDQLGQQLTALRLSLERHQQQCPADSLSREEVERALMLARGIDDELDFLAWELRPAALDDLGLAVALPRYVAEWTEHYGVEAECRTAGFTRGLLPPDTEVAFYRIAQEALNNVAKHAHASRVDVILERREGSAVLVVEDDGVGFEAGRPGVLPKGVGLLGMQERAGLVGATLQIESRPGDGTTVFLRCPIAMPVS